MLLQELDLPKKMRTLAPNDDENDCMDDNETEEEEEEDEAEAGPVMPRPAPAAVAAAGPVMPRPAPAAGPIMPRPAPAAVAAAGPILPQWRDLGPPPDAIRAEAGPVAPTQIKVERQALAAPEQPVMQIVSVVAAPDMVNTEAQAVPLMANAETQHVSSYRSWAYTGENFISPSASKNLSPAYVHNHE
jgi:hypothetical protein